jgi:YesN/AraC family two-component response regulator
MEGKKTILLVEDDDVVRDMIKGALEKDYHILEASTCSQAIPQIEEPLDVALVDYNLPDSDGFDVLKSIREVKPDLPVIFMTAYSTESLAIKALRAGVTEYMKKPLSFVYLFEKLSEILEGKRCGEHPESVESREEFIMDCTAAFIEDHYGEDLTRDTLAERARMERHQFSRAFNRRFGRNVRSYLNNVRLSRAADLLRNSADLSITHVAARVGYGSTFHFERSFKRVYGMTPGEYRRTAGITSDRAAEL